MRHNWLQFLTASLLLLCPSLLPCGGSAGAVEAMNSPQTRDGRSVTVRGTVKDVSGTPLPGVVVLVKDKTSTGVMTDIDGSFTTTVPSGSVLVFTCMGFRNVETTASSAPST